MRSRSHQLYSHTVEGNFSQKWVLRPTTRLMTTHFGVGVAPFALFRDQATKVLSRNLIIGVTNTIWRGVAASREINLPPNRNFWNVKTKTINTPIPNLDFIPLTYWKKRIEFVE